MNDPLSAWRSALPGKPRCDSSGGAKSGFTNCWWDQLGIEILTSDLRDTEVTTFTVYMNVELSDTTYRYEDDPPAPPPSHLPAHSFSGYLELDGFGIDRNTKFWELEQSIDPAHNLRCGSFDCGFPIGLQSPGVRLYLELHGLSKQGTVLEFTLNSTKVSPES